MREVRTQFLRRRRCRYSSLEIFEDAFDTVLNLMQRNQSVPGQSAHNFLRKQGAHQQLQSNITNVAEDWVGLVCVKYEAVLHYAVSKAPSNVHSSVCWWMALA